MAREDDLEPGVVRGLEWDPSQETKNIPWAPYHPVYLNDILQKKEEGILINPNLFCLLLHLC